VPVPVINLPSSCGSVTGKVVVSAPSGVTVGVGLWSSRTDGTVGSTREGCNSDVEPEPDREPGAEGDRDTKSEQFSVGAVFIEPDDEALYVDFVNDNVPLIIVRCVAALRLSESVFLLDDATGE
jgi:hypothetical protein